MRAFRIADRRFPIFDGTGAGLVGGRWNSRGRPVIYAAETFAGAMLEILARGNLYRVPKTYVYTEVSIPEGVSTEHLGVADLPGWDADGEVVSRSFGNRWLEDVRSAILVVPSAVTRGVESNLLINPMHGEFDRIGVREPQQVVWDSGFFSG